MKKQLFAVVVLGLVTCVLAAAPAAAQSAITGYELRVYAPGASAPQQTTPIALSSVQCNQPVVPASGTAINPTRVAWTDPSAPTRDCVWTFGNSGVIPSLPPASYEATLVAINAAGSSAESNRAPFVRANPPGAPTNLRFGSAP